MLVRRDTKRDIDAIAAREAEILGKPQRIAPLPIEEVRPEAWTMVNEVRGAIGLKATTELPGYSLTLLKHPELFRRRSEMGTTLFGGSLPPRERELAVLRVGWLLGAPFEWGEHVAIGRRCGISAAEIEHLIDGSGAPSWTAHEAAILRGVEEMLSDQVLSDDTWTILASTWSEQQLIEFPMLVGQYACTAIVQNVLRIRLESGNAGLKQR